jgi:hypothetical protein
LDAFYAKEIQDIYTNYLDTTHNQNERSSELKAAIRKFSNKLDTLKFASAPLTIAILNVMYGLSSHTRDNLDLAIIQAIKKITTDLYNIYKHSIMADDLINTEELVSEGDDLDRILYLCFESCFNIAHDGVKYRKSREIFNLGVTLPARILGGLNKSGKSELLAKYEARYDQLENSINDSGFEVDKLKECLKLLKKRFISSAKDEQTGIEKELLDLKFNFY